MKTKKILNYCLLPLMLVLALVGFPLPIAPRADVKPGQEQSAPLGERK